MNNRSLNILAMALSSAALLVTLVWKPHYQGERSASLETESHGGRLQRGEAVGIYGSDDDRLHALQQTVADLARRMAMIEDDRDRSIDESVACVQKHEFEALRRDVDALRAMTLDTKDSRQGLKELVRSLHDEVLAEQMNVSMVNDKREHDQRIRDFVDHARLSPTQAESFVELLQEEDRQHSSLLANLRSGALSREDMDAAVQSMRSQTENNLKRILSSDQYSQYQKMRQDERRERIARIAATF
jgi:hypothetical protein